MLKQIFFLGGLTLSITLNSQTAWQTNASNTTGNALGTANNKLISVRTNATDRMVINGNKTVGINGYGGQVTNGFIGIGPNPAAQGFPWNAANAGPFSLLHLNSGVGGFVQS